MHVKPALPQTQTRSHFIRAVEWLFDNREFFDVSTQSELEPRARIKAFGELLLIVGCLLRSGAKDESTIALSRFIGDCMSSFDFDAQLSYYPDTLTTLGYARRFCDLSGAAFPIEPSLTRDLFESGFSWAQGFEPFRRLDALYNCMLSGVEIGAEKIREHIENNALLAGGAEHLFSISNMYAMTHSVFYLTDFGFGEPARYLSPSELENIRMSIRIGLGVALRDGNLDLLGEYVICWLVLRMHQAPLLDGAIAYMLSFQDSDGSLPAAAVEGLDAKPGPITLQRFVARYHSTCVTALMARTLEMAL